MSKPVFKLQIINALTNEVIARFGGNSPLERELVADIVTRTMATLKGVNIGMLTRQKTVEAAVQLALTNAINAAIMSLKEDTIPLV